MWPFPMGPCAPGRGLKHFSDSEIKKLPLIIFLFLFSFPPRTIFLSPLHFFRAVILKKIRPISHWGNIKKLVAGNSGSTQASSGRRTFITTTPADLIGTCHVFHSTHPYPYTYKHTHRTLHLYALEMSVHFGPFFCSFPPLA